MAARLLPGERAKLSAAASVLQGTTLPAVAALKSEAQEPPPADPVQEARALASVFSLPVGTVSVEGIPDPGETPVVAFARLFAVRKALSSPVVLVQLAPTLPPLDINGASAQTEAAVVTSFRTKELPALMLPQGPSAVMSQREELAEEAEPGWPPLETR